MRNKRLDILRCVAILLVLGRHSDGPEAWKIVGWAGVDLFFVLSGFLISGLLFAEAKKTGRIRGARFLIRRGFKIYPAFYAMLSASLLGQILWRQPLDWKAYLPEIFFYQCYTAHRVWSHTWSLAVEEHFYIFLLLILLLLLRFNRGKSLQEPFRAVPFFFLFFAIACLGLRLYEGAHIADLDAMTHALYFPTHLRIDSLFFGVFLGYLHHFRPGPLASLTSSRLRRLGLLVVSVLLVSSCYFFPLPSAFMLTYGLTFLYLGFGGILVLSLYAPGGNVPERPFSQRGFRVADIAAFIGKHSYSIYLWHALVGVHSQGFLRLFWRGIGPGGLFGGYLVLSLVVGIALSMAIEYPTLKLRDRLVPSSS